MDIPQSDGEPLNARFVARLIWGFVALGILLRVGRYLLDFPLWWDEAFVTVNFLRRGYLGLLRPLDYGQVCPLFFLWAERSAVRLFGFSTWSLRLFPLLCGLASVPLFRHVAGRLLAPWPRLAATAFFAVSFYPIRHAADVKPYASDLLAALVLIGLALEWLRARDRVGWLWVLAAAGPLMVGLSHPAAFVAGGVGLGLLVPVWKERRAAVWAGLIAYGMTTVGAFAALFLLFTRAQAGATLGTMAAEWSASFPPLDDPIRLAGWLVETHTGNLFAYPLGANRAGSMAAFGLFVIGAAILWRQGDRAALAVCLGPFLLGLIGAALRRYPYGGSAHGGSTRFMQYLAPSIALLAGLGLAAAVERISRPGWRRRSTRLGLIGLALVGIVPVAADVSHPYRAMHARASRDFARRLWPDLARDAEVACLRWDLGVGAWDSVHLGRAVALCNEAIESPARQQGGPRLDRVGPGHPLRCVLVDARDDDDAAVAAWLGSMRRRFDLVRSETIGADMAGNPARPRPERYILFEFRVRVTASDRGNACYRR